MDSVVVEKNNNIAFVTLNRIEKYNAFDDEMIENLSSIFKSLAECSATIAIVLKANGKHFSAGADLAWMKRMKNYSQADNFKDSKALAELLHNIYNNTKPVVASVQGCAFGGGVGLIAACDFAICTESSSFCFSETKLGLIPAVISPYVVKAIGQRQSKKLFLTAEKFNAEHALSYNLVQTVCRDNELADITLKIVNQMTKNGPNSLFASKKLINDIAPLPVTENIQNLTAERIALQRISAEGQEGLSAFFDKRQPKWDL